MMRDLYSNLALVQAIIAQIITIGGGAKNSGDLDLRGFDSAMFSVNVGASGDALAAGVKFDIKMEHADDDGTGSAGAYSAVTATDIVGATPDGSGNLILIDDPAEDSQMYGWSYIGHKRFGKVTITPSAGNTNGTPFSIDLVKGHAHSKPVN
jgi:hypothetical protein